MKRFFALFSILLCLISLLPCAAFAEEAQEMTKACTLTVSEGTDRAKRMLDDNVATGWAPKEESATLTIESETPIQFLYVQYLSAPQKSYSFYTSLDGVNYEEAGLAAQNGYLDECITLPAPVKFVRLAIGTVGEALTELHVYGEGTLPKNLPVWQPTPEKCDLLVISAHPDDDMLFMGGSLAYYGGEKEMNAVCLYMSHQKRLRQTEAQRGLWTCGITQYPIFAGFEDVYSMSLEDALKAWPEKVVMPYLVEQVRKYKPEVVVTHDVNGEYGHGAHRLVAHLMPKVFDAAADPAQYPESYEEYGAWQIKKLYLHLYKDNQIEMMWDTPCENFGGKTAFEMAKAGYDCHVSQHVYSFAVRDTGKTRCTLFGLAKTAVGEDVEKNDFFENIPQDDITYRPDSPIALERVRQKEEEERLRQLEANKTPVPTEIPTPAPTFTPEITPSEVPQTQEETKPMSEILNIYILGACALLALFILIVLFIVRSVPIKTIMTALAFVGIVLLLLLLLFGCGMRVPLPESPTLPLTENPVSPVPTVQPTIVPTQTPVPTPTPAPTATPDPLADYFLPKDVAPAHNIINDRSFAMYKSSDLSILIKQHVVQEPRKQIYYEAHIRLRNGEQPKAGFAYQKAPGDRRTKPYKIARQYQAVLTLNGDFLLTEDVKLKGILIRDGKVYSKGYKGATTLAFMPDNSLKVFEHEETTPEELLAQGVMNTYSFGPILVEDGQLNPDASKFRVNPRNPRCGIGMIEPGHLVAIVCEGRGVHGAAGYTLDEFAQLFYDLGCQVAYNLDGGASSSMCFMGDSLNTHETEYAGQRPVPDVIIFGQSDDVPNVDDKIINDGNGLKKPPRGTATPKA